jgi:mycothiol synthase
MTIHATPAHIREHADLSPNEISEIRDFTNTVSSADGMSPLSEHVLIHLHHGLDPLSRHFLARDEQGHLVGYLHLDQTDAVAGAAIEVAVLPSERGHGIGSALVRAAITEVGNHAIRLWAHGKHAGAHQLAHALGFEQVRELWQMRRSLFAPIPKPSEIAGISIRQFISGQDDQAWVDLNHAVFIDHPEQGAWTIEDLHVRMSEAWFDAAGFFVAVDDHDQMLGFVWTKMHGGLRHKHHEHPEIGEIYVLGVAQEFRNKGISTVLTIKGLEYLRSQGLPSAMLYVDEDNTAAIELYKGLGFTHWDTDVMFKRVSE